MRKHLHWASLLLLWPGHAQALPDPLADAGVTEDAVITAVLADHPAVAAVQARIRGANLIAKRFEGLPPLGFRATVSQIDPSGMMRPTVMLMAEQIVPLGGQRQAAADAVLAAAAVQQVDERNVQGLLRSSARIAFASYRGLHARRTVLMRDVAGAEQTLRALVGIWGAGRGVSVGRLVRLQAEIETLHVEIETVDAGLPLARHRLNALLGRATDAELGAPSLDLPEDETRVEGLAANHPALERLDRLAAAARARSRSEAAANALTLMPGAGVMTMEGMTVGFLLTVGVVAPGLQPGRSRARVAEGMAEAEALGLSKRARERDLAAALDEASGRLQQIEVRRKGLRDKVLPALRKAVQAAIPSLVAGTGTVAEIAEGMHRLHEVDLQFVDLDTQWLLARAALLQLRESDSGSSSAPMAAPGGGDTGMSDIGGTAGMGM